jgi:hypothetical protein
LKKLLQAMRGVFQEAIKPLAKEHKHNHVGLHPKPGVDTCRKEEKVVLR